MACYYISVFGIYLTSNCSNTRVPLKSASRINTNIASNDKFALQFCQMVAMDHSQAAQK
jgi:hypothetical protein